MTRPSSPRSRPFPALAALATAVAASAATLPVLAPAAASAATSPATAPAGAAARPAAGAAAAAMPSFQRSISGTGSAAVYAWGLQHNPVTDEVLVSDYWNFQIRRYDTSGRLLGSFYRPASGRRGQPYSIAVDPRDGSIWVGELADGKPSGYISHYDKTGTFLGELNSGARYNAWIATAPDGTLYVADSHYWDSTARVPCIRSYSPTTLKQINAICGYGSRPGELRLVHGMAVAEDGRLFVANAGNGRISVFSARGDFLYDFGVTGRGPGRFLGDMRGLTVDDANGLVYVADSEASEIEVFTLTGTWVRTFGSEGDGPGQMADGARQIDLASDGSLLVADYGNYRVLRFDATGTLLGTFPSPAGPPPPGGLAQPRDVAVSPTTGEVLIADAWNNRFQSFQPDGAFVGTWGSRNSHPPYGMNYPRGVAVDPATGRIWVANTREHLIRVYDQDKGYLFDVGDGRDSTSKGSFRWPMDIEFDGTGGVWISDDAADLVKQVRASDGVELRAIATDNHAVAVDAVRGRLWIVDNRQHGLSVYSTATGRRIGSVESGLSGAWDVDVSGDRVYVTDTGHSQVVAYDATTGSRLGAFGSKGTLPGQFSQPSGLTHDAAGLLLVADAGNNRVQVFGATPLPGPGAAAAKVGVTSPARGATVAAGGLVVTGTATDDTAVTQVQTSVQDVATGLWWNARLALWGSSRVWNDAWYAGADLTTVTWSAPFVGAGATGQYRVTARARDAAGTWSTGNTTVPFSTGG